MKNEKYTMHVVSHTHWDREWRYPFQEFRMLLIDMFDELIDLMKENPDYKYFLLDSQTMPLDDYLEIKPENEDELRQLVKAGRIHIGPWYTLPDTPEISGESIIRNLLKGMLITEEWQGQKYSGYSPFSFGQSSQMPQIYRGFGIDHMFFYRGNSREVTRQEFIWQAPDGSQIMGMRSVNPYGRANWYVRVYRPVALNKWPFEWDYHWRDGQLPFHPCDEELQHFDYWLLQGKHLDHLYLENLAQALKEIKEDAKKDSTTNQLLYLDGMDQVNAYPRTPEIIKEANKLDTGDTYKHSSFYDFVEAVKAENPDLETIKGEFRYTMKDGMWQNLFPGMLCARMYLKQQNRDCEFKLQKNADTWSAFAHLLGMEYPKGMSELAWKYQLANQSHDSIAGCSVDEVHEDVEYRNRQVRHLADNISRKSMAHVVTRIDNSALEDDAVCVIAFNPTQFKRTEVVKAVIDIPEESEAKWFTAEDDQGNPLPVQFRSDRKFGPIIKNPYEFPVPYKARRFHCAVEVKDVPGVGYKTVIIKPQSGQKVNRGSMAPGIHQLENEFIHAKILADGRIDLTNKETGKVFRGLHYYEDRSDIGDHATQQPADEEEIITSIGAPTEISKTLDGPLMVQYRVKTTMQLPKNALKDGSKRNSERLPYRLTSFITLRKGSRYLEIKTKVDNQIRDHKLRAMFPSYLDTDKSYSETHFDVTERDIHLPDTSTWKEPMLPYYPQYMFCGVEDGEQGLAIFNKGLPEYAVHEDKDRTIGLTLLRTYRFPIIGADPEDVEVDESQVMCQCLRSFTFEYAVFPYKSDWQGADVYEWANRFSLKLHLNQTGKSRGELPSTLGFIDIEPKSLILSAIKKSSRRNSLIVRLFNPTEETVQGVIRFWQKISKANFIHLNEEVDKKAEIKDDRIPLAVAPNKIITLEVYF